MSKRLEVLLPLALLALACSRSEPCDHQQVYTACMQHVLTNPPSTEEGWAVANSACFAKADREAGKRSSLLAFSGCR